MAPGTLAPGTLLRSGLLLALAALPAWAVDVNGTYPSTSTLPASDVNAGDILISDYVGNINTASGVYLGNGWVITAAHIDPTDGMAYTLDNQSYTVVNGSETAVGTNTDLVMFQITGNGAALSTLASLGTLSLATSTPANGTSILMIGYGDGASRNTETWGTSQVVGGDQAVTPQGLTTSTLDFAAYKSPYTTYVVEGDSGGGGFVLSGGKYVLAGLIEAQSTVTDGNGNTVGQGSALMDLTAYAGNIATIMNGSPSTVPEPGTWALLGLGGAAWLGARLRRPRGAR